MAQIIVPLLVVNLIVLLAIGLVRQQNPFDVFILMLLIAGNAVTFLGAALLTHSNTIDALASVASNVLPPLFVVGGFVLLLFVMGDRSGKRQPRA